MEIIFKSCPFCGGKSAQVRYEAKRSVPREGCFVYVVCGVCGASTKRQYTKLDYEKVKEMYRENHDAFMRMPAARKAVEFWNMRSRARASTSVHVQDSERRRPYYKNAGKGAGPKE